MIERRSFLAGLVCALATLAIVRAESQGGAIDVLQEWRITSAGWGVRPEAISLISAQEAAS
jgi:hypothetical protein